MSGRQSEVSHLTVCSRIKSNFRTKLQTHKRAGCCCCCWWCFLFFERASEQINGRPSSTNQQSLGNENFLLLLLLGTTLFEHNTSLYCSIASSHERYRSPTFANKQINRTSHVLVCRCWQWYCIARNDDNLGRKKNRRESSAMNSFLKRSIRQRSALPD